MVLGLWAAVRASLPDLDGELPLTGLAAPVVVERDAAGVPVIRGGNRSDVARATGFLHAQERFFQMDLTRRAAAGELSELLGSTLLGVDLRLRLHRLTLQSPLPTQVYIFLHNVRHLPISFCLLHLY